MPAFIDLTGQRFGRLVAKKYLGRYRNNKNKYYKCKCDCGNTAIVFAGFLRNGHTKSCGCYKKMS